MHNRADYEYYFRYLVLLGGGFLAGYLLTQKSSRSTKNNKLFAGVAFAALAIGLSDILDMARFGYQNMIGEPAFPWGNLLFEGVPLLAVIAVLLIAYFSQFKSSRSELSLLAKMGVLLSFAITQVYALVSGVYFLSVGTASYDPNMSVWAITGGYLISPLAVAIVSYLILNINKRFDRLFYAALVGMLYAIFTIVLWEFRTDASYQATNIFGNIVSVLALAFAAVLLWRARKTI